MICDFTPLIEFLVGLHLVTVGLLALIFAWLKKP